MAAPYAESLQTTMTSAISDFGAQLLHPNTRIIICAGASLLSVPLYRIALHAYKKRHSASSSSPLPQEYHDDIKQDPQASEALYAPHGLTSFLSGTLTRRLPANSAGTHSSPTINSKMHSFLASFAWANHDLITRRASALEPTAEKSALYLQARDAPASGAWLWNSTNGEILNVSTDGSSRMVLSLADAATAVLSGWAERHPLSGAGLPWGYVVVKAPRDESELAAWKGLVLAGVRFCSAFGAEGVEVRRVG